MKKFKRFLIVEIGTMIVTATITYMMGRKKEDSRPAGKMQADH